MRAQIVLEGELDPAKLLIAELTHVIDSEGKTLEIAGLVVAADHPASQHLGRDPEGHPLIVYTKRAQEGPHERRYGSGRLNPDG